MVDIRKDEHNHIEFESTFQILIHFLCLIVQFACVFSILALQIILTITQTCAFRIGIGFWSFPFLIIAPISIWIFLWKRNLTYCFIAFIIHICSNLFATAIIIISFLVLIEKIGISCSISNNYSFRLNISLIIVSSFLKIFLYGEIILLYMFRRYKRELSILFEKNYQIILNDSNTKIWNSLKLDFNTYENSVI